MDTNNVSDEHEHVSETKTSFDTDQIGDWLNNIQGFVQDGVKSQDPIFFGSVLVAIFVIITTIFLFFFRGRTAKRNSVLFVGLCYSGKTLLFSKLIYREYVDTQTSIKENIAVYTASSNDKKSKTVRIVDIPGHERVRHQFFDQFKTTARAVVFLIDSITFQKEVKDVAECIYSLLVDKFMIQNAIPILVACNKQDLALAKGASVIRPALEKELNNVRVTQSASLQAVDGKRNNSYFLGSRKHDFTFADLRPTNIEFVECSAKSEDQNGLHPVEEWLLKVA